MPTNIKLIEKQLCKKRLYKGGAVNFNVDTVKLINGKTAKREYIDHPGAVAVLPVLQNGDIVLVRQYRYPIGEVTWEIPAGKMHYGPDNPLKRAKAELSEETGYTGKLKKLLSFWPCCAFSNECLHIYTGTELKPGKSNPDDDEFLNVMKVPYSRAVRMTQTGEIKDSKTIIAILAYKAFAK